MAPLSVEIGGNLVINSLTLKKGQEISFRRFIPGVKEAIIVVEHIDDNGEWYSVSEVAVGDTVNEAQSILLGGKQTEGLFMVDGTQIKAKYKKKVE